eukprot:gene14094-18913_t
MLKLTYFNIPGRAYAIRACFNIGGIPFEDETIEFSQLNELRGPNGANSLIPLGSVPVLTLPSGEVIAQSGAILRYAGKLAKLYPENFEEALKVDEILETVSEVLTSSPQHSDPETKKALRLEYASGKLKKFYNFYAGKLEASGGSYIATETLSIADVLLYAQLKSLRKGSFDYIPSDYDSQWPILQNYIDFIESDPVMKPYHL